MIDKLLSSTAVAELVGLAPATLAKRRLTGEGPPFIKLGSRVLYPMSELQAWIDAQPRFDSTSSLEISKERTSKQ
jgi:predicted DNA-binding transcriptional regulator AlpA